MTKHPSGVQQYDHAVLSATIYGASKQNMSEDSALLAMRAWKEARQEHIPIDRASEALQALGMCPTFRNSKRLLISHEALTQAPFTNGVALLRLFDLNGQIFASGQEIASVLDAIETTVNRRKNR